MLLFGRGAARASVTQNENRRSAHEVREREREKDRETKRQLKEMCARSLLLLLVRLFVLLYLRPRGMMMI